MNEKFIRNYKDCFELSERSMMEKKHLNGTTVGMVYDSVFLLTYPYVLEDQNLNLVLKQDFDPIKEEIRQDAEVTVVDIERYYNCKNASINQKLIMLADFLEKQGFCVILITQNSELALLASRENILTSDGGNVRDLV